MRVKSEYVGQREKVQILLQKQLQIQAELQKCEDNLNLFEEYYLQNSWKTGNVFLGWPVCTYNEITEFMNRPRGKKNLKPYVEIQDHEKLFSISSITSEPFLKISKVNYLATKELGQDFRPKINRTGKKSKHMFEKRQTFPKLQINFQMKIKQEEQVKNQELDKEDSEQISSSQEHNSESEEEPDSEIIQSNESDEKSECNNIINRIKTEENKKLPFKMPAKVYNEFIVKQETKVTYNPVRRVTFLLDNDERTISLEKQLFIQKSNDDEVKLKRIKDAYINDEKFHE